ncbi:DUF2184 domain-containing protein, partial [Salmonella enterica subsp. enterica serovar Anatum]|nr:DUF2184 domain-containing protein [Salmonella enterica subsp. enterica serovar Anatum]
NDKKYVRYPLVPLQSVPVQYRGLYQIATYYGKLGAVEPVYKEIIAVSLRHRMAWIHKQR